MSLEFTQQELDAIRSTFCKGFTDDQFQVCLTFCRVRNLLPGKHVVFQLRQSNEWDEILRAKQKVTKIIFITTIDASRLIAQRTGQYGGQAPEQYIYLDADGSPSVVSDIPLPQTPLPPKGAVAPPREPWAVRTTVFRKDFQQPVSSVARFDAYASTYNSNGQVVLSDMWVKRGPEQLAKCSEMLSLRKAFPEELGGLHIAEEFKAENEEPTTPVAPAAVIPELPSVPKVDQTPVVGKDAPRPGEKPPIGRKTLEQIEEIVANPTVQAKLAEEGKKINHGAIDDLRKEVEKQEATTAPTVEPPNPRKRKKKESSVLDGGNAVESRPVNGPDGITDEDLAAIGTPAPQFDEAANQKAATEFVEGTDPTPTKEELAGFSARVRALVDSKRFTLDEVRGKLMGASKKENAKDLTVGDWKAGLATLEAQP